MGPRAGSPLIKVKDNVEIDFMEKVKSGQRYRRLESYTCGYLEKRHFRLKEQPVQRPEGRKVSRIFGKQ